MKVRSKRWCFRRHQFIRNLSALILRPYVRFRYGISIEHDPRVNGRQFLILLNHQTPFDQFFVALAFPQAVYYVATEDLFSGGVVSRILEYLVAPIPIKKSTTDVRAVMTCMRVAKEGGTIAIAPEGNRTFSGATETIKPSIAALARALKLPIAFFRIEGGYGKEPRWSNVVRNGPMSCGIGRILEPEEYAAMNDDELCAVICRELRVDESRTGGLYRSRHSAEYLERLLYVCPTCGLSDFRSDGEHVTCKKCGVTVRYDFDKHFYTADGKPFVLPTVKAWYDYQNDFVRHLDLDTLGDAPIGEDTIRFSEVIPYKHKNRLAKSAALRIYRDRITIGERVFPFTEISSMAVMGRNKLNLYVGDKIYQCKGSKRFCAVRPMQIFYHGTAVAKGNNHDEFLGL